MIDFQLTLKNEKNEKIELISIDASKKKNHDF